jgi:hypothetical protein
MKTGARSLLALLLALALVSPAVAKRPKYGVFGKINGQKFRAKSNGKPEGSCVFGTYRATGGVTLAAGECDGKSHDMPRAEFAQVWLQCDSTSLPATPPYDAACDLAVYSEARIEGEQAFDMKVWTSRAVKLRVDRFDGKYVRGVFTGDFDQPQPPLVAEAPVKGKVRFLFPVKAVE